MADIDPNEIIDLGKSRDEEFDSPEEKNRVFFPGMSLDAGLIPGEVGSKTFIKVLVEKTSASKTRDGFDMMNMRVLGSADKKVKVKKQSFDDAIEIVIKNKDQNTDHEEE